MSVAYAMSNPRDRQRNIGETVIIGQYDAPTGDEAVALAQEAAVEWFMADNAARSGLHWKSLSAVTWGLMDGEWFTGTLVGLVGGGVPVGG